MKKFKLHKLTKYWSFSINYGMANRLRGEEDKKWALDAGHNPCFEFFWWFWFPHFYRNDGRFKKREVVDFVVDLFCFWLSVTFYPRTPKNEKVNFYKKVER